MPRLRVLAGPSPTSLTPISELVNTTTPYTISSDRFHGQVVVNIKGFDNGAEDPRSSQKDYFERPDRQGITWSIQVQGRFLTPCSADDVLFGNTFDRQLKLPWGSGAALKFMKYIDPVLEHDLASATRPWALSPLIATMPHFAHRRLPRSPSPLLTVPANSLRPKCGQCSASSSMSDLLAPGFDDLNSVHVFPPAKSVSDDLAQLHEALYSPFTSSSSSSSSLSSSSSAGGHSASSSSSSYTSASSSPPSLGFAARAKHATQKLKGSSKRSNDRSRNRRIDGTLSEFATTEMPFTGFKGASERRSHFSSKANREAVVFGPQDLITTDFCYGFLEFAPQLALALPGGLSFDLARYWDGQPVRFVCCERKGAGAAGDDDGDDPVDGESDKPWGRAFWCVVIELEE